MKPEQRKPSAGEEISIGEAVEGESREEREKLFSRRVLLQWSLPAAAAAIGAFSPSQARAEYEDHSDYTDVAHGDEYNPEPDGHEDSAHEDYTTNHMDVAHDDYEDGHLDHDDIHGDHDDSSNARHDDSHEDYTDAYWDHDDIHVDGYEFHTDVAHSDYQDGYADYVDIAHADHDDHSDSEHEDYDDHADHDDGTA